MNEKEAADFASYFMDEIENKGKQLAGKLMSVNYSPALLQSTIVLYLRTRVGYKDQHALSPPAKSYYHLSTASRHKGKQRILSQNFRKLL